MTTRSASRALPGRPLRLRRGTFSTTGAALIARARRRSLAGAGVVVSGVAWRFVIHVSLYAAQRRIQHDRPAPLGTTTQGAGNNSSSRIAGQSRRNASASRRPRS